MDYERLRDDLKDYFGTAMMSGNPMAIVELSIVENASVEQLENIAIQNGFNLEDYNNKKIK